MESAPTTPEVASKEDSKSIEGLVVPLKISTLSFLTAGKISEISVAEGDYIEAGENLVTLHTPELDTSVLIAEASLEIVEAEFEYWKRPRNKPPERRWWAESRVESAKAALKTTLASQEEKLLVAPFNATVIKISTLPGEFISPYQDIILLADLSNLIIETTNLSEREIINIDLGQNVTVNIKALDMEIKGEVIVISPLGEQKNGDVFYIVTIQLRETPNKLRWGMSTIIDFTKK